MPRPCATIFSELAPPPSPLSPKLEITLHRPCFCTMDHLTPSNKILFVMTNAGYISLSRENKKAFTENG